MTEPTFDTQGYPTEETLAFIRSARVDFRKLLSFVHKAWQTPGDVEAWRTDDGLRFRFVTLGWSGNEELIQALEDNKIFWFMCWQSSVRGGSFEFMVPNHAL